MLRLFSETVLQLLAVDLRVKKVYPYPKAAAQAYKRHLGRCVDRAL